MSSEAISDEEKLNITADIDTLQSQLQKPEPDKNIIQKIWSGIEKTVTLDGFAGLIQKVGELIAPLI